MISLSNRQYYVITDPVGEDGKPQLGKKKLIKVSKAILLIIGSFLKISN